MNPLSAVRRWFSFLGGRFVPSTAPLSARPGLAIVRAADGYLIYDVNARRVHHLNPAAALVFDLCDGTRVLDDLRTELEPLLGADAWEELGDGFSVAGDESRARLAYANALRAGRGEPVVEMPGRDMRQRIHDEAVIEQRDEHGVPRLPG